MLRFTKASGEMTASTSDIPAISGCATKQEALLELCIEYDIDIDDVDGNIDWLLDLKNGREVMRFQVVVCHALSIRKGSISFRDIRFGSVPGIHGAQVLLLHCRLALSHEALSVR
jgi:hypothetical protein